MRKSQHNNARIYERNIVPSLACAIPSSKSPVGRLPVSCASNHISKTMARERERREGGGKWQMKEME